MIDCSQHDYPWVGMSEKTLFEVRVGAKYIGTCTCLYLSTLFRVLACTLYLSFKNVLVLVLVLVPKYITKYLQVHPVLLKTIIYYNLLFQLFSALFLRIYIFKSFNC